MTSSNQYAVDTQQRRRSTWRQVLDESAPLLLPVATSVRPSPSREPLPG